MKSTDAVPDQLTSVAGTAQKALREPAGLARAEARKGAARLKATVVERLPRREAIPAGQDVNAYGEIDWERADRTVVLASGLLAALVDTVLVGTPSSHDARLLVWPYPGSPLTRWLHPAGYRNVERRHRKYGRRAPVPYDAGKESVTGGKVTGLRPNLHRLQGIGHDPVVGVVVGVRDLRRGMGTYYNMDGQRVMWAPEGFRAVGLRQALSTQAVHAFSDVGTKTSLPPPLFSLLQVGQIKSPFALEPHGKRVSWTHVARHMYKNGYNLRHFVAMAIVPGIVEVGIRGYWLLTADIRPDRERNTAKLASMLLGGHTIALSGNVFKTAVVFRMNPAALNWAELLAMGPTSLMWSLEHALQSESSRRAKQGRPVLVPAVTDGPAADDRQ